MYYAKCRPPLLHYYYILLCHYYTGFYYNPLLPISVSRTCRCQSSDAVLIHMLALHIVIKVVSFVAIESAMLASCVVFKLQVCIGTCRSYGNRGSNACIMCGNQSKCYHRVAHTGHTGCVVIKKKGW